MNENVKINCSCDTGFDKGAYKKTLENNIFTLFGNLYKGSSVVLRYHGMLTENIEEEKYNNDLFIQYFLDNDEENIKTIPLHICTKCSGECYCIDIDLEEYNKISFCFKHNDLYDKNNDNYYTLNITKNPLNDVMQKYGFEKNKNLPVTNEENKIGILKKIFDNILKLFKVGTN